MSNSSNLFAQFSNGKLTTNEFAVMVAVSTMANDNNVVDQVTSTEIAENLHGNISRHAVLRALRNLQKKDFIHWHTSPRSADSYIEVR